MLRYRHRNNCFLKHFYCLLLHMVNEYQLITGRHKHYLMRFMSFSSHFSSSFLSLFSFLSCAIFLSPTIPTSRDNESRMHPAQACVIRYSLLGEEKLTCRGDGCCCCCLGSFDAGLGHEMTSADSSNPIDDVVEEPLEALVTSEFAYD